MNADDEVRFITDAHRLLGDDVETRLLARGWAVTDLGVGDDEPLEFYWPPTAPVGHGDLPEPGDGTSRRWPQLREARRTPWSRPTRIVRSSSGWRVEYGAALAQEPDPPRNYSDDQSLLAELEAIECWPMPVEEARRILRERVFATTTAGANDDHSQAVFPTEPYASRMDAIRRHQRFEYDRAHGIGDAEPPSTQRPRGDLRAMMRLVDAEAWASAVRTAQAGGEGWGLDGPG